LAKASGSPAQAAHILLIVTYGDSQKVSRSTPVGTIRIDSRETSSCEWLTKLGLSPFECKRLAVSEKALIAIKPFTPRPSVTLIRV
jgi:hypothetical protein